MPDWPLPPDEAARLDDLYRFDMLDTPSEEPFDTIAEVAAALLDAPISTLGFLDEDRLWFKARVGTPARQISRSIAFCRYTILSAQALVIEDVAADPRFADHPAVSGLDYPRFYAGAALVTHEGRCVGTLCVLDVRPRTLTPEQTRLLERLASQAVDALEFRRLLRIVAQERESAGHPRSSSDSSSFQRSPFLHPLKGSGD